MQPVESNDVPDTTCASPSCRVVLCAAGGWDVIVEDDREVVSIRHCTEWHRVERCTMQSRRAARPLHPGGAQCRR
jgi:hypothetical protein